MTSGTHEDQTENSRKSLSGTGQHLSGQTEQSVARGARPADEAVSVDRIRDVEGKLAARSRTLKRMRDGLILITDHIEDEGDRVYFGSTNDADQLKELVQELDEWCWHDILVDAEKEDPYASARAANARAAHLTDLLTRLRDIIALALDIVPESAVTLDAHDVLTLRQRLSTARLLAEGAFSKGPAHG